MTKTPIYGQKEILNNTSATSARQLSSSPHSSTKDAKNPEDNVKISLPNQPPYAKDDMLRTEENKPAIGAILKNDVDLDGDKLKLMSVPSHTKKGGTVITNDNGTITFLPATDFIGLDTFSYVITDGKAKTDKGQVIIIVAAPTDTEQDQRKHATPSMMLKRNAEEGLQNHDSMIANNEKGQELQDISVSADDNRNVSKLPCTEKRPTNLNTRECAPNMRN